MNISDVKENRGKISGQSASIFKMENVSKELGNILHLAGYETSGNFYYKRVGGAWHGWDAHVKELLIDKVVPGSSIEAEIGYFTNRQDNYIAGITTVEELNKMANILL
jgi:hypothetical protein